MSENESKLSDILASSLADRDRELAALKEKAENEALNTRSFGCIDYDKYEKCISPREALALFKFSDELSVTQLTRELRRERAHAAAAEVIIYKKDEPQSRLEHVVVPSWVWWRNMPSLKSDFWDTEFMEALFPDQSRGFEISLRGSMEFFGLRFWPEGLPSEADSPNLAKNAKNLAQSGRPAFPHWDAMWRAILTQIRDGTLEPNRIKDIVSAMEIQVDKNDWDVENTSLRTRASELFHALSHNVKKSD